jgi:hypothetical protein
MYNAVCDESITVFDTNEFPQKLAKLMDIRISIGSNMIVIPNNADSVEAIFMALQSCDEMK